MLNHIPEEKMAEMFKELSRVVKQGTMMFMTFYNAEKNTKVSETDIMYSNDFVKNEAKKHGFKDCTTEWYKKLMETDVPGWEFMRQYNWNYLLLVKE